MTLPAPTLRTLKKYGLDDQDFWGMADAQSYVCAICRKLPESGKLDIDHEHVRNWKRKKPVQRAQYVRGLLCSFCNHRLLRKGWTLDKLRNAVRYMERYENARPF